VEAMVAALRTAAGGSSSPLFLCWFQLFLFFHSPCTLKIPRFVPLFTPKIPPCSYLSLCPKTPPDSIVCFSLSPKFSPFVFCSVFIGNLGRGSPYPVQAQGMVVGARVF